MFGFTNLGWLIFRETHIDRLLHFLTLPPWDGSPDQNLAASVVIGMSILCSIPLLLGLTFETKLLPRMKGTLWQWPLQTSLWTLAAVLIVLFYRTTQRDFVYFQF